LESAKDVESWKVLKLKSELRHIPNVFYTTDSISNTFTTPSNH